MVIAWALLPAITAQKENPSDGYIACVRLLDSGLRDDASKVVFLYLLKYTHTHSLTLWEDGPRVVRIVSKLQLQTTLTRRPGIPFAEQMTRDTASALSKCIHDQSHSFCTVNSYFTGIAARGGCSWVVVGHPRLLSH